MRVGPDRCTRRKADRVRLAFPAAVRDVLFFAGAFLRRRLKAIFFLLTERGRLTFFLLGMLKIA
jgi:hypothetical protein